MDHDDAALDAWTEILLDEGEGYDRNGSARRVGGGQRPTFITQLGELGPGAFTLHFSTTLDEGVDVAEVIPWLEGVNSDCGLNRVVAYPDGVVAVELQLLLPRDPGVSVSSMYLVLTAMLQQRAVRDHFLQDGPQGVLDLLWPGVPPLTLDQSLLQDEGEQWSAALADAALARLGCQLERRHGRDGGRGTWDFVSDEGDGISVWLQALAVDHPTWGPCLDRLAMLQLQPARQHAELIAGLSRSRHNNASGAGAWTRSLGGRLLHRLTVPLSIFGATEELRDASDHEWVLPWMFDSLRAELQHVTPWLVDPAGGLASLRHLQARTPPA